MRKFGLLILLTFAVMIPAVQAQVADVPNFRRVADYRIRVGTPYNKEGYRVYHYHCYGHNENLAKQYVSLLQENGLTLIEHKEKSNETWNTPDFWLEGAWMCNERHEDWFFDCKGHQIVFSLSHYSMYEGGKNPQRKENMYFHVKVASDLTYEED